MFSSVLIANRGAIACRIQRTLRRLGIRSVAIYSEADRGSLHVRQADHAIRIGTGPAADSYLVGDRIIEAALASGAQAIHPGYGFLSENAQFAEACERAGIAFVGPTPEQIRSFGLKHTAKEIALANGLPLLPGSSLLPTVESALQEASRLGYPVMLKSTAGGGGIGMQQCANEAELKAAFESVRRLASSNFSNGGVFLEKFIARARHVEVQLFGDGEGQVIALGERDCSMQRRNQKVIEETPAPGLSAALRAQLSAVAARLGQAVAYRSAGTVEFIVDADKAGTTATDAFYFLEVNTRLQVEHGVTEAVTGIDLVEWMLKVAAGEPPDLAAHTHKPVGVAIQARLYAEDPSRGFRPSSGLLTQVRLPEDVRVDGWIDSGSDVPPFYDPMLAKVIAHAASREAAIAKLDAALASTQIYGVETNLGYLRTILAQPAFCQGLLTTRFLDSMEYRSSSIEVISPGTMTTVQDWPGRLGHWDVGVPPSGPMDSLAFRLGNRLIGNPPAAAGLEITANGPTLNFACPTTIVLSGAPLRATLDGVPVPMWTCVDAPEGSTLVSGAIDGDAGQRGYLAVRGGLDVAPYLGSRSTFTLGKFGGHAGRALRTGDILRVQGDSSCVDAPVPSLPVHLRPRYERNWTIAVLYGPHGAPDFFTTEDIAEFFATSWEVHYNSSRTGVRLIGPKPRWARRDGGEAGLHPSNIHDNAYAVGAIDFTGDMPVILGPDGPSLGGFVCPATVALADLWKIGQLRPGDRVRFTPVGADSAQEQLFAQDRAIASLSVSACAPSPTPAKPWRNGAFDAILALRPVTSDRPQTCYRQSGEDNILIEYGPPVLDLALRFRVQALLEAVQAQQPPGILDLTPGVRSLQVHFDCRTVTRNAMLELLLSLEDILPDVDSLGVTSRIVHLPLSWDDPSTRLAIERYMTSVRPDAPWCPSNIEFIRRINGLQDSEEVKRIVFDASYLVMGLGDVYLGAPVATPLDPRHRLVTTKYNPARTWTPENAVGIGGAYLCVYGMEGPGGYQFVGRTVQMWNRYRQGGNFLDGKQWLLRFFDQLRFYPVSAEELEALRNDIPNGKAELRVETSHLRLRDYRQFLAQNADSIATFKARQQAAFEEERERWGNIADATAVVSDLANAPPTLEQPIPPGCIAVTAPLTGSVWQIDVQTGDVVGSHGTAVVLEAMKMEISVQVPLGGTVVEIRCQKGQAVAAGDTLLVLRSGGAT